MLDVHCSLQLTRSCLFHAITPVSTLVAGSAPSTRAGRLLVEEWARQCSLTILCNTPFEDDNSQDGIAYGDYSVPAAVREIVERYVSVLQQWK